MCRMVETPLAKKLQIKTGYRVLLVNQPDGFRTRLDPLPDGVDVVEKSGNDFDAVLLFVSTVADLERNAVSTMANLKPGGVFWISYPKRSSGVETDITRDAGWDALRKAGWRPVTQVSIDDTWSALRFRPTADVKPRA